jgi:hypothetical protein
VERERDFTPGEPPTWHVKWRPIARSGSVMLAASTAGLPVKTYSGIRIFIDRPAGFVQEGIGADGKKWERTYAVPYGFIEGTRGGDREEFDVFCGPNKSAPTAFVVTQTNAAGKFDEYKMFLGFDDEDAARACYVAHIPERFLSDMFALPAEALRGFLGLDPRKSKALNGAASVPLLAMGAA